MKNRMLGDCQKYAEWVSKMIKRREKRKNRKHYVQWLSIGSEWLSKMNKVFLCALLTLWLVPRLRDVSVVKRLWMGCPKYAGQVSKMSGAHVQNGRCCLSLPRHPRTPRLDYESASCARVSKICKGCPKCTYLLLQKCNYSRSAIQICCFCKYYKNDISL